MNDLEKAIEEWKEVAMASDGKYKTARGAAFASYYNKASGIELINSMSEFVMPF